MREWKYKVEYVQLTGSEDRFKLEFKLESRSKEGWELVSMMPSILVADGSYVHVAQYAIVLRRPV